MESQPVATAFSRKSISIPFLSAGHITPEQRWTQTINDNVAERQFYGLSQMSGFSVHANVSIDARDRLRLERLARYVSRPAVSTERLSELPDGRLLYRLKRRWRNGTTEVVFQRSDFIAKLAALVPAPRAHLRTYHGILAPAAKWRPRIVEKRQELGRPIRSHTGRAIRRMRPRSRPAGIQPTPGKRTGRDGVRASAAKKKLFMVRASETGVRN